MSKVPETQQQQSFPDDLQPQPCFMCRRTVVYVLHTPTSKHGRRPVALEIVPAGTVGCVAIETSLIGCGGFGPCAYETNLPTRYRWHGPHCTGPTLTPITTVSELLAKVPS